MDAMAKSKKARLNSGIHFLGNIGLQFVTYVGVDCLSRM